MSKFEPKNKEEAFTYQWEDDVLHLRALSRLSVKEFRAHFKVFKQHIEIYEKINVAENLLSNKLGNGDKTD